MRHVLVLGAAVAGCGGGAAATRGAAQPAREIDFDGFDVEGDPDAVPRTGPSVGEVVVTTDDLSYDGIRKVIRRGLPGVLDCYEERLKEKRDLAVTLTVTLRISPSGTVSDVSVSGNDDSGLRTCISEVTESLSFGPTPGCQVLAVTYPLLLAPVAGKPATDVEDEEIDPDDLD